MYSKKMFAYIYIVQSSGNFCPDIHRKACYIRDIQLLIYCPGINTDLQVKLQNFLMCTYTHVW